MKIFSTRSWTLGEIACLKWSSILLGLVVGAQAADTVKRHTALLLVFVVLLAIKPVTAFFRKP